MYDKTVNLINAFFERFEIPFFCTNTYIRCKKSNNKNFFTNNNNL